MLFCLSVNYTAKGLDEMGKNPKTNRWEAVEKLLNAAGGKMVSMYATIAEGPGAMVIFDIDPAVAPAIVAVAASSDAVHNIKMQRLFTTDEMMAIRAKRVELQAAYAAPGQESWHHEAALVGGLSAFGFGACLGILWSRPT